MSTATRSRLNTIWGLADRVVHVADGIQWASTPSHGGYVLSEERAQVLRDLFPSYYPWGGDWRYHEEDCDWCVVPIAFPEFFEAECVERAAEHCRAMAPNYARFADVVRYLDRS